MRKSFLPDRLEVVNKNYLEFELRHLDEATLKSIGSAYSAKKKIANNSNSALLYVLGIAQYYNPNKKCKHTVSGSGPDIDTDFSPSGINKLIRALQKKYGESHIAKICTYTPWNLKTSMADFVKVTKKKKGAYPFTAQPADYLIDEEGDPVYGHYSEGQVIADAIPDSFRGRHTRWKDIKDEKEFAPLIRRYGEVFKHAGPIDGQPKNNSIHACGVIIGDEDLSNTIPLRKVKEDSKGNPIDWFYITQWEGFQLEEIGFTKYDLLVIDNLQIIDDTCRDIGKTYSWIEEHVPLNDEASYNVINNGFVGGLFQIEEGHVVEVIQKTNPRTVDDIAAISAVIRPGPRDSGLLDDYIKFKETGKLQNKLHPLLDSVLYETGGVMIYQEQVLKALEILSGMNLATADEVRRAMGKKKIDLMKKYEQLFIKGCHEHNSIKQSEAKRIWNTIAAFADYGFNKSHAYAYAIITYWTAYLKAHYPVQFMMNLLSSRLDKPDKLQKYIRETRLMNINVLPPSVNSGGMGFTMIDDSTIAFGLNALSGIGETQTEKILEARGDSKFLSIEDFFSRIDRSKVNSKVTDILVKCGAFDSFNYDREKLVELLPSIRDYYKAMDAWQDSIVNSERRDREIELWEAEFASWEDRKKKGRVIKLLEPQIHPELGRKVYWDPPRPKKPTKIKMKEEPKKVDLTPILSKEKSVTRQMINWEAEYCKFFITAHPLDFICIPEGTEYNLIEDIDTAHANTGRLIVAISNIEEKKIKSGKNKGKKMGIITVQDNTGYAELVIFASQYTQLADIINTGEILYLPYRLDNDNGPIPKILLAGRIKVI